MNVRRCHLWSAEGRGVGSWEVGGGGGDGGRATRGPEVLSGDKNGRQASSPSVSGEHIVGVSEAVAAR